MAKRISGHKSDAVFTPCDVTFEQGKREALIRTEQYRETRTKTTILPMTNAAQ